MASIIQNSNICPYKYDGKICGEVGITEVNGNHYCYNHILKILATSMYFTRIDDIMLCECRGQASFATDYLQSEFFYCKKCIEPMLDCYKRWIKI